MLASIKIQKREMSKEKRKFKITDLSPMNPVKIGTDIKVVSSKNFDLGKLDPEQIKEAFKKINKKAKQTRSKGVIVTQPHGDYSFICTTLNSGANKKNVLSFPEPSLARIYLRTANDNFHYARKYKNKLLNVDASNKEEQYDLALVFIKNFSVGCIMTIASLEAFMNSWIPVDIQFVQGEDTKDKIGCEYLDFNTKVTDLMPHILGKSFHTDLTSDYQHLSNCNSLRDHLIHPKAEHNENKTMYENLLKSALDLPMHEVSDAAFNFMNYYKPDYIVEFKETEKVKAVVAKPESKPKK